MRKVIAEISRIVLGAVFVFSGFVKAVDPWGSIYKIEDYLAAFDMAYLNFAALPLAYIQIAVEFSVGMCLLLGVYRRINTVLALVIMIFMTPLTLYLAITDRVSDCGCFGDALALTNWQTFFKNLPLLLMAVYLYFRHRLITPVFTKKYDSWVSLWVYAFIFGVAFYSFFYLPILDFRPYKVGAHIPALMEIPEDAEQPVYDTKLIYSKDGIQREFTLADYPKGDSSWVFVNTKTTVVKKGYEPPVHDFSITTEEGYDITDHVLADPNYTFLLIARKLSEASVANTDKINNIYRYAKKFGYGFYALTSSFPSEIKKWTENTGAEYPFCTMDDVTLKTIIRSNPGLLLIKNGTIIDKWPHTALPITNYELRITNYELRITNYE